MGQYYYVVNVDKKEFLYPHKFGDGIPRRPAPVRVISVQR